VEVVEKLAEIREKVFLSGLVFNKPGWEKRGVSCHKMNRCPTAIRQIVV
jgi:hypothetical protein